MTAEGTCRPQRSIHLLKYLCHSVLVKLSRVTFLTIGEEIIVLAKRQKQQDTWHCRAKIAWHLITIQCLNKVDGDGSNYELRQHPFRQGFWADPKERPNKANFHTLGLSPLTASRTPAIICNLSFLFRISPKFPMRGFIQRVTVIPASSHLVGRSQSSDTGSRQN